jgi:hypothetical protein
VWPVFLAIAGYQRRRCCEGPPLLPWIGKYGFNVSKGGGLGCCVALTMRIAAVPVFVYADR